MKGGITAILVLAFLSSLSGQKEGIKHLQGVVTFKASENIYVRFGDTETIQIGDTLFYNNLGILSPCMTVSKKSSSSCICLKILDCKIQKDDEVTYIGKPRIPQKIIQDKTEEILETEVEEEKIDLQETNSNQRTSQNIQKIRARASAATYSNFSNGENDDRHRTMLRFSMNADHINNSKLSLETYVNYRKNFVQGELPAGYQTSFINVYNLAATYDVDSTLSISIGRKINRKISSIGPIDGVQVEKHFKSYYVGGVAGFKPDISGFEFNSDLYEFGGYLGHHTSNKLLYTMTTFGMLEQHNGGPIDRRYVYLQHSSTWNRKFSFFSSVEVDVYDNINGITSSKPRLTNLYLSTRYRANRRLSLTISYDARKRIIFYETLRTEVERLLADDQQRQGIRGRINFRPIKYINTSISYSKRFQSDNQNKSDNINATISHSKLPLISGRLSFSFNRNESNYLTSNIMSFRYSRPIVRRKLQGDFYYRTVKYDYGSNEFSSSQYYLGTNLSIRLSKTFRLSILGEVSTRETDQKIRINTKLIKRFKS